MKHLFLMFLLIFSAVSVYSEDILSGTCTGDDVMVREGKGPAFKAIDTLNKGEKVTVVEIDRNSEGNIYLLKEDMTITVEKKKVKLNKGKGLILIEDKNKTGKFLFDHDGKKVVVELEKTKLTDIIGFVKVTTPRGKTGWTVLKYIELKKAAVDKNGSMVLDIRELLDSPAVKSYILIPDNDTVSIEKYENRSYNSLFAEAKKAAMQTREPKWKAVPGREVLTEGGYYWLFMNETTADQLNRKADETKKWPAYFTLFKIIKFEKGKNLVIENFKNQFDGDSLCEFSCPYFYIYHPVLMSYEKQGEILKDLIGKEKESLVEENLLLNLKPGKLLKIMISEEKDEISYIDYIALRVNGKLIYPSGAPDVLSAVSHVDGSYHVLRKGERIFLKFDLSAFDEITELKLITSGYYLFDSGKQ